MGILSRYKKVITLFGLLLFIAFVGWKGFYVFNQEKFNTQETIIYGYSTLMPNSPASLRIFTLDHKTSTPIKNANVKIKLLSHGRKILLFKGKTDDAGTLDANFKIPKEIEGKVQLIVQASSSKGKDIIKESIELKRSYKILLTTDKPVYQPGQTIKIRALVLDRADLTPPANKDVTIEVEDSKANKVFKKIIPTDKFGIVSAEFTLADEINMGRYHIKAILEDTITEKEVNVYKYTLPKFKIKVKTDKNYYLPGDSMEGEIHAEYFFRKPVSYGDVEIKLSTFDVQYHEIGRITGITDKSGFFKFEFKLPDYFVGIPLEKKNALLTLDVKITDKAKHDEKTAISLVIFKNLINIVVIPESKRLIPDVENIVYIMTTYPDGKPVKTKIKVVDDPNVYETDQLGIAEISVIPKHSPWKMKIYAVDEFGNEGEFEEVFEFEKEIDIILLRPDKTLYNVGDTLNLTILSSQSGSVFIDMVKNNQTIFTKSGIIENGKAILSIDLSEDMFGTIQLHAYRITQAGDIIRDTRLIYVAKADELKVEITTDKDTYLPAEEAKIIFKVKDETQSPKVAALGVNIVDEAVFFLQELQPGLEKVYFTLEKELMEPKYEVHGYSIDELVKTQKIEQELNKKSHSLPFISTAYAQPPAKDQLRQKAATILFASAEDVGGFTLKKNSYSIKINKFKQDRINYIKFILCLPLLTPLFLLILLIIKRIRYPNVKFSQEADIYNEINALLSFTITNYKLIFLLGIFLFFILFLLLCLSRGSLEPISIPFFIISMIIGLIIYSYGMERIFITSKTPGLILLGIFYLWMLTEDLNELYIGLFPFLNLLILLTINQIGVLRRCILHEGLNKEEILKQSIILSTIFFIFLPILVVIAPKIESLAQKTLSIAILDVIVIFIMMNFIRRSYLIIPPSPVLRHLKSVGICIFWLCCCLGLIFLVLTPRFTTMREPPGIGFTEREFKAKVLLKEEMEGLKVDKVSALGVEPKKEVRVREYFPETLYSNPAVITDDKGIGEIIVKLADSITTWKLNALASSLDGKLGSNLKDILVFQDFFIDIDFPRTLTLNDEVSIPVAVYNYLKTSQNMRLKIDQEEWFQLKDEPEKELAIEANDVGVVYFRIKVNALGRHKLTVYGYGEEMSDAVRREVEVVPDGEEIIEVINDRLSEDVKNVVRIPLKAIDLASKMIIKIYPGMFSQIIEGLENIFQMPFGCFEQTSSTTYPNILVLNYMKQAKQITPELQMKAEGYINTGYQRLLSFEVPGGGFSLFGDKPANVWLSAYGLMEFNDMNKVYPIDKNLIARTQGWLISQQNPNGSFETQYTSHGAGGRKIQTTAYVAWALLETGFSGAEVEKSLAYIRNNIDTIDDAYTLGLCANALVLADPKGALTTQLLDRLIEMRSKEDNLSYWKATSETLCHSYGKSGDIETSALIAHALLKANKYLDVAEEVINYLIKVKDQAGTWYSTQATVLALKALVLSLQMTSSNVNAQITILANEKEASNFKITPKDVDVLRQIDVSNFIKEQDNIIEIRFKGQGTLFYQITTKYYLPWKLVTQPTTKPIQIDLSYDRARLKQDDIVNCEVRIANNRLNTAQMVIVDLGIPPGFDVQVQDLKDIVTEGVIKKFSLTERQIIIYIEEIGPQKVIKFTYRLKAKFPIKVKAPKSVVYEYYNPEVKDTSIPIQLEVL